jgi:hypothetical protein
MGDFFAFSRQNAETIRSIFGQDFGECLVNGILEIRSSKVSHVFLIFYTNKKLGLGRGIFISFFVFFATK